MRSHSASRAHQAKFAACNACKIPKTRSLLSVSPTLLSSQPLPLDPLLQPSLSLSRSAYYTHRACASSAVACSLAEVLIGMIFPAHTVAVARRSARLVRLVSLRLLLPSLLLRA